MVVREFLCSRNTGWLFFVALMLTSPMACASDFGGFITVFVGFPSVIFCDLVLGLVLIGFNLGTRGGSLILLPLFAGVFLLFMWIAFIYGVAVIDGLRDGVVFFAVALAALVSCSLAICALILSFLKRRGRDALRKVAAWVTLVFAAITSLAVAFDFYGLLKRDRFYFTIFIFYSFLLGLALFLHVKIVHFSKKLIEGMAD